MLRLWLLPVVLSLGCSSSAPPLTPSVDERLGTLVSMRPVHVEEGFTVWKNGTQITVKDGLLLELTGVNSVPFRPRALPGSSLMLGDTSVRILALEEVPGVRTRLLADASRPGMRIPLWRTAPDILPKDLDPSAWTADQRARWAATPVSGLTLDIPPASTPRVKYRTLEEVRFEGVSRDGG